MTGYSVFAIAVIILAAWLSRQVRKATEASLAELEEKKRMEGSGHARPSTYRRR